MAARRLPLRARRRTSASAGIDGDCRAEIGNSERPARCDQAMRGSTSGSENAAVDEFDDWDAAAIVGFSTCDTTAVVRFENIFAVDIRRYLRRTSMASMPCQARIFLPSSMLRGLYAIGTSWMRWPRRRLL